MANENKRAVVAAIWENPQRAFGCQFRQAGRYWENLRNDEYDERGKIRLALTGDGGNIMVFYNGSSRQERTDVFTYLNDYVLHTGGFRETLQRLGELYNLPLQLSTEERQAIARATLAREVAASLVEYLRTHPNGVTGNYLRNVRGIEPDGAHFGELTKESIAAAQKSLKQRGISYDVEDFKALGLTEYYAEQGFNCVIPYRVNGYVRGFVFRNTNPDSAERYRYSMGLGRGGYCDTLTHGEPAVIVEGQFDAVRLIQAGVKNVIGVGGAKIGEEIARLLHAYGITQITYIPDVEYNERGERKTKIVADAIRAFQSAQVDGVPVVSALFVADLPTPEGVSLNGLKIDVDAYGKEHGGEALTTAIEFNSIAAWAWELNALNAWAVAQENRQGTVSVAAFRDRFADIYNRCNPFERQAVRNHIDGNALYNGFGITAQSLSDVDEWRRNEEYNNRIKDGAAALNKAVQDGASPEQVAAIVRELSDAQATNTRDEWDAQLQQTFDDELRVIKEQPATLKTKWEIGAVDRAGKFYPHDVIEFYPADVEVFCAPTSHGKTMILFQSVLDLLRTTDKTYLFVSCEENKRQLLERALNVFIDIPATKDGVTSTGEPCFISQTRRRTIKAVLRGDVAPYEYTAGNLQEHAERMQRYDTLTRKIREQVGRYEREIFPRLKLIHTEATTESICSNIRRTVEDFRRQGVDVGGVFLDYVQLLTTDARNYSRHDELKDICKALKDCAARTELPIIVAAQLNRQVLQSGIDAVTVANLGEGADIERIAHDVYLVWQVDKTQESLYKTFDGNGNAKVKQNALNVRSSRLYTKALLNPDDRELKTGYIYIERLKARDGKTDGWGLLPYDGERGYIGENDTKKMTE